MLIDEAQLEARCLIVDNRELLDQIAASLLAEGVARPRRDRSDHGRHGAAAREAGRRMAAEPVGNGTLRAPQDARAAPRTADRDRDLAAASGVEPASGPRSRTRMLDSPRPGRRAAGRLRAHVRVDRPRRRRRGGPRRRRSRSTASCSGCRSSTARRSPSRASRPCCWASATRTSSCSRRSADDTPVGKFLAKRGPGMHHTAYRCADVASALEQCRSAGCA